MPQEPPTQQEGKEVLPWVPCQLQGRVSHPSLLCGDIPLWGLLWQRDPSPPEQGWGQILAREGQEGTEKGIALYQPELGPVLNAAALSL